MTKKVQATVPLIQVPLNVPVTAVYRPLDWEAMLLTDLPLFSQRILQLLRVIRFRQRHTDRTHFPALLEPRITGNGLAPRDSAVRVVVRMSMRLEGAAVPPVTGSAARLAENLCCLRWAGRCSGG